jgi:uncharacterized protein
MDDAHLLELIRSRLGGVFPIKRIVLFGSRARGQASSDSDFDILLVVDTEVPFIERQGRALQLLGPRTFPLDLLVYTADEVEKEAAVPGSAVFWALQEGKELYAA